MVGLSVAEWILVAFLSIALFIFLVVGTILCIKLINLTKEANKIVLKGQDIAEKADNIASKAEDVAENVKGMTSVGGVVKTFTKKILENEEKGKKTKKSWLFIPFVL